MVICYAELHGFANEQIHLYVDHFPHYICPVMLHDPRLTELTDPRPQIQKAHRIFNCADIRAPDLCVVGQLILHNDYCDKASVSGISHNYLCACVSLCVLRTFKIYTPGHSQYTVQYC